MQMKHPMHGIVITLALPFPTAPHARFLTAHLRSEINSAANACGLDGMRGWGVPGNLSPHLDVPKFHVDFFNFKNT